MQCFNLNSIYSIYIVHCSSDVIELHATSHPLVPLRLVAACSDGAVRLVSPISGTILTTSLLHHSSIILNTLYKAFDGEEREREREALLVSVLLHCSLCL